jgi:hypothetical protein
MSRRELTAFLGGGVAAWPLEARWHNDRRRYARAAMSTRRRKIETSQRSVG